ncbi:MAG TPA: CapA family protein [Devosia sp.]|nr:CapA family protein [Devosia sp.]
MTDRNGALSFIAVGDVAPQLHDNGDHLFTFTAPTLNASDFVLAQLETSYSERGTRQLGGFRWRLPRRPPLGNITSMRKAGINIISFASNHALDYGEESFFDTIDNLKKADIGVVGVGKDLAEARTPLIVEKNGVRVAVLAYNSILPQGYDAAKDRPGCNPIKVSTYYEQVDWQPGTPPKIVTIPDEADFERLKEDVRLARAKADVVVVSQHCGVHLVPDVLAQYQKTIAHAAVDEGADLVVQHHSHSAAGIEVYKGKAIFYGLGVFAHESVRGLLDDSVVKEHHEQYGLHIDEEWKLFPFPPESRKTLIVRASIDDKKVARVVFLPCLINQKVQAEILGKADPRSQDVVGYFETLTKDQGFKTKFTWEGDEVVVTAAK